MDLSEKQTNKMFLISLFQTFISVIAFILVTYILINVSLQNEILIYLILDIVIIGFIVDGVFSFIKYYKSLEKES